MRSIILAAALLAAAAPALAQQAPASPPPTVEQLQATIQVINQQRMNFLDNATALQVQLVGLQAQVADLQKQLDAAKAPAKPVDTAPDAPAARIVPVPNAVGPAPSAP